MRPVSLLGIGLAVLAACGNEQPIEPEPPATAPAVSQPEAADPAPSEPAPAGRREPDAAPAPELPGAAELEWSADGALLLVTHDGGASLVPSDSAPVIRLRTPPGLPTAVAFAAAHVVLGHDDGHVRAFDVTGRAALDLTPPGAPPQGFAPRVVAISADGRRVAASFVEENTSDQTSSRIHVWDAGKLLREIRPEHYYVSRLGFAADGRRLIAAGVGASTWDVETGRLVRKYETFYDGVFGDAVPSPDGVWMAEEGAGGHAVVVWPLSAPRSKKHIADADGCHAHLVDAKFSRDNKALLVGGQDGSWRSFRVGSWKPIAKYSTKHTYSSSEMADDGRTVLEVHDADDRDDVTSQVAEVWDAVDGRRLATLAPGADSYALSPDARFVAGRSVDAVHVWDARTGRLVRRVGVTASEAPKP